MPLSHASCYIDFEVFWAGKISDLRLPMIAKCKGVIMIRMTTHRLPKWFRIDPDEGFWKIELIIQLGVGPPSECCGHVTWKHCNFDGIRFNNSKKLISSVACRFWLAKLGSSALFRRAVLPCDLNKFMVLYCISFTYHHSWFMNPEAQRSVETWMFHEKKP